MTNAENPVAEDQAPTDASVKDPEVLAAEKVQRMRDQLASAEKALEAARVTKANAAKIGEFKMYVHNAIADGVKATGIMIPSDGMWLKVTNDSQGNPLVDVLDKLPKATRTSTGPRKPKAEGNGSSVRLTISALGITEYTLPDGKSVKSPAALLDAFSYPHYASTAIGGKSGDAAHRQIYKWIRENPAIAAEILVTLPGGSTPTLLEAVEAQGFTLPKSEVTA